MIEEFVQDVCEILNIDAPTVLYDTKNFPTSTMMAQYSPDGSVIFVKKYEKPNPDQLFSIAHELRHVWQMQNDPEFYLSAYKSVDLCTSLEEYNLQIAEIDANAFAGLVMIDFFHIRPLFEGMPETVRSRIFDRMDFLKTTQFSQ